MATKNVQVNEKEIFATSSPSTEPIEANEAAVVIPERNLTRAIWTIIYAVALPSIPIIIISSILLYIIFQNRLHLNPGLPELQIRRNVTDDGDFLSDFRRFRKEGGEWAYYVQYNPSTITTIASWTSRIVPYLSSSIMALVALFAARHIVLKSKHGDDSQLPNPEQLALLIGTLGGTGFAPLREVLLYRFMRNGRLVKPLPAAISAFTVITIMALLIPVIDTWFGVATTAETVVQIYNETPSLTYGRGISPSVCPNGPADNGTANSYQNLLNSTTFWPCNVLQSPMDSYVSYILGQAEAGNIVMGVSNVTKVCNYTNPAGSTFWYLGSPKQDSLQDYQAKTIATTSQCQPMTRQQCNVTYNATNDGNSGRVFHCNENFIGSFGSQQLNISADGSEGSWITNVGMAFSGNSALTEVTGHIVVQGGMSHSGYSTTYPQMYMTNPLYYGVWALGYPGPDFDLRDFEDDPSYYYGSGSGGLWMLNCSTTVYDVTYAWVNGSITFFNNSRSSVDLAAMLSGPFVVGSQAYVGLSLHSAALLAGSANNSAGIAELFAAEYSKLLLAYSIGALDEQVVLNQQERIIMPNVARVPLIPLYLLIGTKALYVLAVIILAIAAYAFTHPAETELVKDHLSIRGLTFAHFERPDVMQEHAVRQLQSHLDTAYSDRSEAPPLRGEKIEFAESDGPSKPGLRHAATAPAQDTSPVQAKVGLMPAVDGSWQFVVKANGVWGTLKPVVTDVGLQESKAGGLGNRTDAYSG